MLVPCPTDPNDVPISCLTCDLKPGRWGQELLDHQIGSWLSPPMKRGDASISGQVVISCIAVSETVGPYGHETPGMHAEVGAVGRGETGRGDEPAAGCLPELFSRDLSP
jgi:hypothetical protein